MIPDKARYLAEHQDDDALADLLGYVEPKWRVINPVVARALDENGCVITEMACSLYNVDRAMQTLARHGRIDLTTVVLALQRRIALCRLER